MAVFLRLQQKSASYPTELSIKVVEFTIYTSETAPNESKEALAHAKETFGFIPNLEGIFAEAPALLKGSMALWDLFETTSFTPVEQQVIYLTANYENSCNYCMSAHSGLAKMIGMSPENIEALRNGTLIADEKLQALRHFTQKMVRQRGWVEDSEIEAFMAAGYSKTTGIRSNFGYCHQSNP